MVTLRTLYHTRVPLVVASHRTTTSDDDDGRTDGRTDDIAHHTTRQLSGSNVARGKFEIFGHRII